MPSRFEVVQEVTAETASEGVRAALADALAGPLLSNASHATLQRGLAACSDAARDGMAAASDGVARAWSALGAVGALVARASWNASSSSFGSGSGSGFGFGFGGGGDDGNASRALGNNHHNHSNHSGGGDGDGYNYDVVVAAAACVLLSFGVASYVVREALVRTVARRIVRSSVHEHAE